MKKGVSEPISWILLVGLGIMLAGIVTVWVKDTAESTSERIITNVENDLRCNDISINAYEKTPPLCSQILIQNRGTFSIAGIKTRQINIVEDIVFESPLLPGKDASIDLNILTPPPDNKIGIIPITKVGKDFIACMEKEISILCS